MPCDCERDGRDAYRRFSDRNSYETERRLRDGEYGGDECDREFREGFERERRYDEERREEERAEQEREERSYELRRQQRLEDERIAYEQCMGYQQEFSV